MPDQPGQENEKAQETEAVKPMPGMFRNLISLTGISVVIASLAGILFLFIAEITGTRDKPYLGIFAYILFPAVMMTGIAMIIVGMLVERRRRHRSASLEYSAYPKLDLNNPVERRKVKIFVVVTFLFLFVSAFGSYRAYEYTESVAFCGQLCHVPMNPEFVAFSAAPHSRIHCVDCHVGSGADWYVRAKVSGARQLFGVVFDKYQRPIPTPIHNLRPARDTCEQCHWPEKFFGMQLKVFNRYGYDERNTLHQARMLIKTGGGSPSAGPVAGIHWHMNIANEILYAWSDEQRQVIPWVRLKDRNGNVEEYVLREAQLSDQQIEALPKRQMDCVDCHNRPTHIYHPPDSSVDEAFVAGKLDTSLPYLKRQAVDVLSGAFGSTDEALKTIAIGLEDYYRTNHPDVFASKRDSLQAAIAEIQRIYQTNFFPEMKVDWQTHPNNIGHYYSQGCFRCHDGKHVSKAGKIIRSECNICHETLDQKAGEITINGKGGAFEHPGFFGDITKYKCTDCHTGKGTMTANFQHPADVNLSGQKCVDCHLGSR
jgi:hypothetical protein